MQSPTKSFLALAVTLLPFSSVGTVEVTTLSHSLREFELLGRPNSLHKDFKRMELCSAQSFIISVMHC